MTAKALAQLLLRLWGIALIIWGVAAVGEVFFLLVPVTEPFSGAAFRASGAAAALHVLVYLVAGIVLIRNGDRLGAWLVSDIDNPSSSTVSAIEIEAVGFAVLGAYFLITGIRELFGI